MIPMAYITQWRQIAPWPDDMQVEQDLILSRAIIEIFSNPFLSEQLYRARSQRDESTCLSREWQKNIENCAKPEIQNQTDAIIKTQAIKMIISM